VTRSVKLARIYWECASTISCSKSTSGSSDCLEEGYLPGITGIVMLQLHGLQFLSWLVKFAIARYPRFGHVKLELSLSKHLSHSPTFALTIVFDEELFWTHGLDISIYFQATSHSIKPLLYLNRINFLLMTQLVAAVGIVDIRLAPTHNHLNSPINRRNPTIALKSIKTN
jgi:hypothetical protein